MIRSLILASTIIVALMFAWALVQKLWGKTFADHIDEADVLATRSKCGNCHCATACERKQRQ